MAGSTLRDSVISSDDEAAFDQQPIVEAAASRPHRCRCSCGHPFQVYGLGLHRRYYELDDLRWRRRLLTRTCACCQRQLPS